MLVIHELVVHLVRDGKLLDNRGPEKPISSLWPSIESLRCYPLMQSLFPKFPSDSMCLIP